MIYIWEESFLLLPVKITSSHLAAIAFRFFDIIVSFLIAALLGVTNGKIRALPRRRDPSLKIRARALNLFVKSEPES